MNLNSWKSIYNTKIKINPDDIEYIHIRVSVTPDNLRVIADIRKYRGKRATRVGIGLFPNEFQWFLSTVTNGVNSSKEFDFRKLFINHDDDSVTVVVSKIDSEQKLSLSHLQLEKLFELKEDIFKAINEGYNVIKSSDTVL